MAVKKNRKPAIEECSERRNSYPRGHTFLLKSEKARLPVLTLVLLVDPILELLSELRDRFVAEAAGLVSSGR